MSRPLFIGDYEIYRVDYKMKDTGFKLIKKASQYNFLKWGEYMKRAQLAERKVAKLKELLLLTDPVVEHVVMNELTQTQWLEFIKVFPDEGR